MIRTMTLAAATALAATMPAPAQVRDGIDDAPSEQRRAEEFRAAGSKCDAPACRDDAGGIYPPSTRPGEGAKTPSVPAGRRQPQG